MNNAIEIRGVAKRYGDVAAVKNLDLTVKNGEFLAMLGPSGCGKTTTLRMLAGLEQPTGGDIVVKGRRINDVPVHKRNFGMVFQNLALFPHRTAFDNIAFGLKYRNVSKADIRTRVKKALDMVRLPHVEERFPAQLSGGQQQRIAVARAIVIEPDLLLFDEPFSALDAGLREEMRIELKRIQQSLGITTVFVTHDQAEALTMADKVVVMRDGLKEQEGTPTELYNRPATEFVARFFGQVNEFRGEMIEAAEGVARARLPDGNVVGLATGDGHSGPVRLLLRAERIRVRKSAEAAPGFSVVDGTVASADYLGMMVRYVVDVGGLPVAAVQPLNGVAPLSKGTPVKISVPHDAWIVEAAAAKAGGSF